jgi:ABC-type uncharacterized transport system substrate-binding protein
MLRHTIIVTGLLASAAFANAQAAPPPQIGVILQGGPWYAMVDGLKAGLKELKLDDGQHFALVIRDTRGDLNAVAEAAREFESAKVRLIFTASTSVSVAAHRATATTAIFSALAQTLLLSASFSHFGCRAAGPAACISGSPKSRESACSFSGR